MRALLPITAAVNAGGLQSYFPTPGPVPAQSMRTGVNHCFYAAN